MNKLSKRLMGLGGMALVAALAAPSAQAQQIDPALKDSWAFMQEAMPGVPYDVLKGACAEGTLNIYHGTWTDANDAEVAQFKKRFPCLKVTNFESEPGPMRQRYLSELQANHTIADIIQDSEPGVLNREANDKILMNYAISAANEKEYADALKKTGYWYPLRLAMVGIAWNTNNVSDADAKVLREWKGAIDPRWAGKAAVVDPAGGGVGFSPWYAWLKLYGEDFIKKVGDQKPRTFGGINPASAALASGDVSVIFGASETGLTPLWLKGAPIEWSLPEPGVGPVTGQGIMATAPHPNAGKLFQEYTFSAEGYGIWQKLGGAPARKDYKDQRKIAQESWYKYPTKFFEYDTADSAASNKTVIDIVHKYVGGFN